MKGVINIMFNSVNDYHFNRELIMNLMEFLKDKMELNMKIDIMPCTNSIVIIEEISKILFEKFISSLIEQNKFFVEKFLSDKDINAIIKLSEDKDNENQYDFLIILFHNLSSINSAILTYGIYYSIPQKSGFLAKMDEIILEVIAIIKHQLQSKLIVSKESQITINLSNFLDKLIDLFEGNLFYLYKSLNLHKLWERSERELKVKT